MVRADSLSEYRTAQRVQKDALSLPLNFRALATLRSECRNSSKARERAGIEVDSGQKGFYTSKRRWHAPAGVSALQAGDGPFH